ncbi:MULTISPECIES: xanthine dehydrogenase family protein subunit M [unclassified Chelatococcus]|uniref:FAD binding domain-containing protein n=1 Tax=unclassified Chelatococcus TaxID=2638111 RepID=UPI001BCAF7AE|nr:MULTISPECIES: xanthine dehydrogenase family protein subunit M [unclassified Chelatococcus]CAH1654356.1 6-hydroxypseudooxynicotine dehydrogenase complex subunit alpha [Hyphomicrobiales bacterium]MBS7740241.1 xanthine dehydrogenase family protein subunit M [Chelatococcus sp. HY11]MBX3544930.1 xanthine dehydrogenase family protein subunit M [Chelatococcus sp.]MCO5078518.1 xanthine dehydrogenase family protein subunit M [Chelatococcus sp.]CAH1685438.1 6-hydroxypseudooxynicotine dehydrogenase co
MKPAPFDYRRPATKAEALRLLSDHRDDDAKILAGGQSLVPMMNFRMAQPTVIIDINRLSDLAFVEERGECIAIGALTRHNDVMHHLLVRIHLPLLAMAYENVAHHTIRNRGTIGGNVVHADAASEVPAVLTALDAEFVIESTEGVRVVGADDFFLGVFTTAVETHELLVEIRIPRPNARAGVSFEEVSLRKGDFAIVSVAVEIAADDGQIESARIAIGGVEERALRAEAAEQALVGASLSDDVIQAAAAAQIDAISFFDAPGLSAAYRRDTAKALLERNIRAAAARAGRMN